MTTVRLPAGRVVHLLDPDNPTATRCGRPAPTSIVVDAPVTCKRCERGR